MTSNELELINIIRTSENPNALEIAVKVIIDYLTQHGSSEEPSSADQQELSGTAR